MGRVHLMIMEGKAVGCGWNPRPSQVHELSYEHYMRDKANYILCYRCFSKETFPREWKAIHKPVVDDGQATDTQSDSDSNISADTESRERSNPLQQVGIPGGLIGTGAGAGSPAAGPRIGPHRAHPSVLGDTVHPSCGLGSNAGAQIWGSLTVW